MEEYWTVSAGVANHTGHTCRECRGVIYANSPIYVRDGRKIRLFYHEACFSGDSDPRTQGRSSANRRWQGISPQAPSQKGYGKWWTSSYGYYGGLPSKRVSGSVQNKYQDLKVQNGNTVRQTSVSLLVRASGSDDASSSSKTYEESDASAGTGGKNVTLQNRATDDVTLLHPKETVQGCNKWQCSSGNESPSN